MYANYEPERFMLSLPNMVTACVGEETAQVWANALFSTVICFHFSGKTITKMFAVSQHACFTLLFSVAHASTKLPFADAS